jgi:hypothetical protein
MKRIDLVYFHVHGPDQSQELKFSLRSIEKFLDNNNYRIHIIGELPPWLNTKEVNYIPMRRITGFKGTVLADIVNKLQFVIAQKEIGSIFYRMMDDIYFINPVQKADLDKLYALQDLSGRDIDSIQFQASKQWVMLMRNSLKILRANEHSEYNYANHLPRRYSKRNLKKMFEDFDINTMPYLPNVVYYNVFHKTAPDHMLLPNGDGVKLGLYGNKYSTRDMHRMRGENIFLNNGNKAYNDQLVRFLLDLFPVPSKFENQ